MSYFSFPEGVFDSPISNCLQFTCASDDNEYGETRIDIHPSDSNSDEHLTDIFVAVCNSGWKLNDLGYRDQEVLYANLPKFLELLGKCFEDNDPSTFQLKPQALREAMEFLAEIRED